MGEYEARNIPFNIDNLTVRIIIGKPDEPDEHDMIGLSDHIPDNVTSKFSDFVQRNHSLNICVLRYSSMNESYGINLTEFYGNPNDLRENSTL